MASEGKNTCAIRPQTVTDEVTGLTFRFVDTRDGPPVIMTNNEFEAARKAIDRFCGFNLANGK